MIKEDIKNIGRKCKEHSILFVTGLIFSYVIYNMLITNSLVNSNDGLWEYSYYTAGKWSLSLGRWFWLYLDRMRFGISTEPLTSLIALSLFSAGFVFIADLFEAGNKKVKYLASMLFLSSTAVCMSLSYRFMSPTFGLAFLFSVLAVWILVKWQSKIVSVVVGGGLLALSMGLYQAYIGCTCTLLVGYFLFALGKEENKWTDILKMAGRALIMAIVGGVFYITALKLHLKVFQVEMSDYNGANTYSAWHMIKSLDGSIPNTYRVFSRYFFQNYFKLNVLQDKYLFYIIFAVVLLVFIWGLVKVFKQSKIKAVLYLLFVLMIPIASNAVLLVATQAWTALLMTAPMALCFPVFILLMNTTDTSKHRIPYKLGFVIMLVALYGNIYQVQIDQEAMLEGKIATVTMANDIIHDLNDAGYLEDDRYYCFLGVPAGNEMFGTSPIYYMANGDAFFGAWWRDYNCSRRSWQGVFTYLCGTDIHVCDNAGYQTVITDERVAQMPVYPQEGYIQKVGDIIVVKVSE